VGRLAALLVISLASAAGADPLPEGSTAEVRIAPPSLLPVRGPRYAKVTVDVYLAAPFGTTSAEAEQIARRLLERGDLRVVYHFTGTSSPASQGYLELLVEAQREERLFPVLDALLARVSDARPLGPDELARVGGDGGLVVEEVAAALADHRHREQAYRMLSAARATGRAGNQILVNGVAANLRSTDRDLLQLVAQQKQRAQQLLDEGVPLTRIYERLTHETPAEGDRHRLSVDLEGAPARGPRVAPVTIVLFSGFVCGSCTRMHALLRRIDERFPQQIRLVWKHLPTSTDGTRAAEFAAAAEATQGAFWNFYDLALKNGLPTWKLDRDALLRHTRAAGLDVALIDAQVERGQYRELVQHDVDEAHRIGIHQPGTTLVNGMIVNPNLSPEQYEQIVGREIERGLLSRLAEE
jgi:protein-disulfide isomerase